MFTTNNQENLKDKAAQLADNVKGNVEAFGDTTEGLRFRDFQPKNDKPKFSLWFLNKSKSTLILPSFGLLQTYLFFQDIAGSQNCLSHLCSAAKE